MDQPVIAQVGSVEIEARANRASFSAAFKNVERTAADAQRKAVERAQSLARAFSQLPNEQVRVQTYLSTTPLYELYRDRDGNVLENERSDKIDGYEATLRLTLEIRDPALIQRIYGQVVAARPDELGQVDYNLEPGEAARSELYRLAVTDAAQRAQAAATGSGQQLGPIRLIDPTVRACNTDVLIQGAGAYTNPGLPTRLELAAGDFRSLTPTLPAQAAGELPLQPPMQKLQAQACVIYGLR
jgi:uncharacterized protein YggE